MKLINLMIILIAMLMIGCSTTPNYFLAEPEGNKTKYPIVLAHGFNASPDSMWGFNQDLIDALKDDNHQVFVTRVSPFNSAEVRAGELKEQIDKILTLSGSDKVNIIAHSMGGLDARYLISQLDYADHVASLTTISTPHRGTKIADTMLELLKRTPDKPQSVFTNFFGSTEHGACLKEDCDLEAAFKDMAEDGDNGFNKTTPDAEGVLYQSWAGISYPQHLTSDISSELHKKVKTECTKEGEILLMGKGIKDEMDPRLVLIENVVSHGHNIETYLPNDGVVTVYSARWGDFRGCIPADHLDEVGQVKAEKDQANGNTDFNYIRFYRTVAFDLAKKGN